MRTKLGSIYTLEVSKKAVNTALHDITNDFSFRVIKVDTGWVEEIPILRVPLKYRRRALKIAHKHLKSIWNMDTDTLRALNWFSI